MPKKLEVLRAAIQVILEGLYLVQQVETEARDEEKETAPVLVLIRGGRSNEGD